MEFDSIDCMTSSVWRMAILFPFLVAHLRDDHKVDMHILDVYCKSTLLKHLRPDYEPNYNLFIYVTYSTVVPSTCVSISKPSGLGWPLASWAVRSKPETTVTA
ncbi:hypothetical protein V6N13_020788 [Hibiscus sabdariffa]